MIGEARIIVSTTDGNLHQSRWSSALFEGKDEFEEKIPAKGLNHITMPGGAVRKFNGDHVIYTEIETR